MRCLITAFLSATFLSLQVPSVLAQDLRFELQQALEAKNWNRAIEIVDKLIQTNPQEAQQLRQYKTQLQNRLPKTPASTTQTPQSPNSPAATSKPANFTVITPVNPSAWQNARLLRTIEIRHPVSVAAISTDGKTLITGRTGTLEMRNLETGESKSLLDWVPQDWKNQITITAIAISPNGTQFITSSNGIATKTSRRNNSSGCSSDSSSFNCGISLGSSQSTTLMNGEAVQVWDLQTGRQLGSLIETGGFSGLGIGGIGGSYNLLRYSNDGKTFLAANSAQGITWDTNSGQQVRSWKIERGHNFCSQNVDVSSDLNSLVSVGIKTFSESINQGAAGRIQNLATGATQTLILNSPSTNEEASDTLSARRLDIASRGCAAISPDAQMVAIGSKDTLVVWQASTQKLLYQLTLQNSSAQSQSSDATLAFSPDSQVLAVGSDENKILLLNAQNGKQLATLTGRFLTFSPDGRSLLSTNTNGKVQIWGVE
ncbi:MAG: hypothetical protein KME38_00850 [Spirirestis rafaelensis WJT71-NPBG6]|jgi:WD40 repeat protein|nr:hypothetical protein [Spirirestis rafaelensis WJT71-NPBG6]